MTRCPLWPQPPMEDRVVLLNLPSLIWEATVPASLLVEGLKEQVRTSNFPIRFLISRKSLRDSYVSFQV